MIVVTDASPLRYLIVLGIESLLPRLNDRVFCPDTVLAECSHPRAPASVRQWAARPPEWLTVMADTAADSQRFAFLDPGERAALELALREDADAVLIDEAKGRRAALGAGLMVVGTIGILSEAAHRGWLDYDAAVSRLIRETNFRTTPGVIGLGRDHACGKPDRE